MEETDELFVNFGVSLERIMLIYLRLLVLGLTCYAIFGNSWGIWG